MKEGDRVELLSMAGGGLCGLIWLGLCIWALVHVIGSTATAGVKVLWVLLLLFLPVVGFILWLILGPRQR